MHALPWSNRPWPATLLLGQIACMCGDVSERARFFPWDSPVLQHRVGHLPSAPVLHPLVAEHA